MRLDEVLSSAIDILRKADISSAVLDVEVLLSAAIRRDRSFLISHPEYDLTKNEGIKFARVIAQRSRRIPVAYIIGSKEFYGLSFRVTPAVLIPRPETELLVDEALAIISSDNSVAIVVDIGTGSGCIPISIACHAPRKLAITAYDVSSTSLSIARKNAKMNDVSVSLKKGNLLENHRGSIHLLCANLPYLSLEEYNNSIRRYPEIKYEPRSALVAGDRGLALNTRLLKQAQSLLKKGYILLEIGASHDGEIKKRARALLPKSQIEIIKDLANRSRLLKITL